MTRAELIAALRAGPSHDVEVTAREMGEAADAITPWPSLTTADAARLRDQVNTLTDDSARILLHRLINAAWEVGT